MEYEFTRFTASNGHPQNHTDDLIYLKTCYNAIVETFSEDHCIVAEVDVEWYNHQVIQSSREVFLDRLDSEAQWNELHNFSCTEVLKTVEKVIKNVEKLDEGCSSVKDKHIQLQKILFCLVIIWFVKSVDWSLVKELVQRLLSFEGLCCVKTSEKYILKMIELLITLESEQSEHGHISHGETKDAVDIASCDVHPTSFYLFAVILFKKKQYSLTLSSCLTYISSRKHFHQISLPIESLLQNLVACCYMLLGNPLISVVHWRKAVAGLNEDTYMIPLLFNLHRTYTKRKMTEATKEVVRLLAQNVTRERVTKNESSTSIIFDTNASKCIASVLASQENHVDDCRLLYYIANNCLQLAMENEAVYWYQKLMNHSSDKFCLSKFFSLRKFILPIEVPSQMQLKAEQALASLSVGNFDQVLATDASELEYCSNYFKHAQSDLSLDKASDQKEILPLIKSYNASALQFYYCICITLYRVSVLFSIDATVVVKEIDNCLRTMDTVFPAAKLSNDTRDFLPEYDCELHNEQLLSRVVSQKLASAKAKLYFNRALAASKVHPHKEKDILQSLQSSLQYDSKNLAMRWNVVLLLWNIGQQEESIKTWCKTRSLNYKLSFSEIKTLRDDKANLLDACESVTKKELLTKDVSILNELLSILK